MKTKGNGHATGGIRADGHPYLRTGDVAKILDVTPRTVARLIDDGSLPGRRVPRPGNRNERRVRLVDLVPYLRANGYKEEADALASSRGIRPPGVLLVGVPIPAQVEIIVRLPPDRPVKTAASLFAAGLVLGSSPVGVVLWDLSLGLGECVAAAQELAGRTGTCPRQLAVAHGDQNSDRRLCGPFAVVLTAPVAVDTMAGLLVAEK